MRKFLVASLLIIITATAGAQTLDEIVKLNTEAMGGKDKIAALNSVKMSGSMNSNGMDIPLTITKQHMKGMRIDMEIMGNANYRVANLEKGWVYMPAMGMTEPYEMTADELNVSISQFDIQGLNDYQTKGYKVELATSEKVDGNEAHIILVNKNGRITTLFIDKKTNRVVKQTSTISSNGSEVEVVNNFSGYKQNKDGYWFPYTIESNQGTIVLETVETNIPVTDKVFSN